MDITRVDVHCHTSAPVYNEENLAWSPRRTETPAHGGWEPRASTAALLEDMDRGGVSTSMLSVQVAPFEQGRDAKDVRRYCRENNEHFARLVGDHPGRFGMFASLPIPDIDASLEEIAYAFDELHADGVRMETNVGDRWLADAAFAPVFEELNRRKAVIYTHPHQPQCCAGVLADLRIASSVIELGTDTARAILQVVFGGTAAAYSDITFIFSHAGGTMPALIERFVDLAKTPRFAPQFPDGFGAVARTFYYDTAQTSNPAAMSALAAVVPTTQIVFGTDYPYRTSEETMAGLHACGVFSDADLLAIDATNAKRLLPRLTKPRSTD